MFDQWCYCYTHGRPIGIEAVANRILEKITYKNLLLLESLKQVSQIFNVCTCSHFTNIRQICNRLPRNKIFNELSKQLNYLSSKFIPMCPISVIFISNPWNKNMGRLLQTAWKSKRKIYISKPMKRNFHWND